jgi:hypothetical protein
LLPTDRGHTLAFYHGEGIMLRIGFLLLALLVAGCAEQSAMRLAADTVRINVSTAPVYGALEPERRAMVMAAQETVKSGYDKFLIIDGGSSFNQNVIGQTGGYATGSLTRGFTAVGPQPVAMPRFQTALTIKMFKASDPQAQNAVDAHEILKSVPKQ